VAARRVRAGVPLSRSDEREILNHRRLAHPHVLGFREVYMATDAGLEHAAAADGAHLVVVTEHASGGTLGDWVEAAGPLKEAQARRLFGQLVSGLAHCHSRGVVHRALSVDTLALTGRRGPAAPALCGTYFTRFPVLYVLILLGSLVRLLGMLPAAAPAEHEPMTPACNLGALWFKPLHQTGARPTRVRLCAARTRRASRSRASACPSRRSRSRCRRRACPARPSTRRRSCWRPATAGTRSTTAPPATPGAWACASSVRGPTLQHCRPGLAAPRSRMCMSCTAGKRG
jgi:hypothetical protein